jgi:hypothetical protein
VDNVIKFNKKKIMQDLNSSNPTSFVPQLNPYYVTGFSDGESSFIVSISKSNEYKSG